jgi:peptide/nickel transport system permease protein
MFRVISNRSISSIVTIIGASIVSFILLRVIPGNPARLIAGPLAPDEAVEGIIKEMGLNQPLHIQYFRYISDFFKGDWGFSFSAGQPVQELFIKRFPATAELALFAFIIAISAAIIFALLATYGKNPTMDRIVRALSSFGQGVPSFWFALILLIIFFESLQILPGPEGRLDPRMTPPPTTTGLYTIDAIISGQFEIFEEALLHLLLPAITLALAPFAFLVRMLRANLLDVSREPFTLVIRSKGISQWSTYVRHAMPNAILPTLTVGGLILAELMTGSVLVEKIFNWPGVGSMVVDSFLRKDYAVAQAFFLLSATLFVLVNFIIEIMYGIIDPRTRIQATEDT